MTVPLLASIPWIVFFEVKLFFQWHRASQNTSKKKVIRIRNDSQAIWSHWSFQFGHCSIFSPVKLKPFLMLPANAMSECGQHKVTGAPRRNTCARIPSEASEATVTYDYLCFSPNKKYWCLKPHQGTRQDAKTFWEILFGAGTKTSCERLSSCPQNVFLAFSP